MRVPGDALLPYMDRLEPILKRSVHMANKEGYNFACSALCNLLRSLTSVVPINYRSIPEGYDRPTEEYLPIKVRKILT